MIEPLNIHKDYHGPSFSYSPNSIRTLRRRSLFLDNAKATTRKDSDETKDHIKNSETKRSRTPISYCQYDEYYSDESFGSDDEDESEILPRKREESVEKKHKRKLDEMQKHGVEYCEYYDFS